MFPLRDLQDDPQHEKLQGLREEAVLQRVSLCRGACRTLLAPQNEGWGALTSAQTALPRCSPVFSGGAGGGVTLAS